jgi:uncharacterized membrane protein YuzA (DUF378 family)
MMQKPRRQKKLTACLPWGSNASFSWLPKCNVVGAFVGKQEYVVRTIYLLVAICRHGKMNWLVFAGMPSLQPSKSSVHQNHIIEGYLCF